MKTPQRLKNAHKAALRAHDDGGDAENRFFAMAKELGWKDTDESEAYMLKATSAERMEYALKQMGC